MGDTCKVGSKMEVLTGSKWLAGVGVGRVLRRKALFPTQTAPSAGNIIIHALPSPSLASTPFRRLTHHPITGAPGDSDLYPFLPSFHPPPARRLHTITHPSISSHLISWSYPFRRADKFPRPFDHQKVRSQLWTAIDRHAHEYSYDPPLRGNDTALNRKWRS
jgi:hypothetical protein